MTKWWSKPAHVEVAREYARRSLGGLRRSVRSWALSLMLVALGIIELMTSHTLVEITGSSGDGDYRAIATLSDGRHALITIQKTRGGLVYVEMRRPW